MSTTMTNSQFALHQANMNGINDDGPLDADQVVASAEKFLNFLERGAAAGVVPGIPAGPSAPGPVASDEDVATA